jgi:hypothetical protein
MTTPNIIALVSSSLLLLMSPLRSSAAETFSTADSLTFIARAYRFWGRDAVMDHFRVTFSATWKFEPDQEATRIVRISADVAHIFAPTKITVGAAGQPGTAYQFFVPETIEWE